eukprot:CAMPEP_0115252424 /NCGR_PEP_ID=MMETSP0270-20121206/44137_1 /TAXON_ID=71861 /ORGANISM="Scrippsiella trochoidea, Strain CCMP3099" /LENGTH=57 /DNA_ID=CAMNT_0002667873 /DNA_START=340 /DNA_END=513 /DNA_ORIENTATION=+
MAMVMGDAHPTIWASLACSLNGPSSRRIFTCMGLQVPLMMAIRALPDARGSEGSRDG